MKQEKDRGEGQLDGFLEDVGKHARKGRTLLHKLKNIQAGRTISEEDLLDLFVQGLEMGIKITSGVKFFKVKLDEYAPAVLQQQESKFHHYDSDEEAISF